MIKKKWITELVDRTPEWFEYRKKGLGASESGIVCGLNPYRPTKMELYHIKVGTEERLNIMSEAAFHGIHTEDYVARLWQYYDGRDNGYMTNYESDTIQRNMYNLKGCVCNPAFPWLFCNYDRVIKAGASKLNADGTFSGERLEHDAPLEIKTMSSFVSKAYDGGVPDYYISQVHQQMLIMESDYAEIAVLIDGRNLKVFPIERDEAIIDMIIDKTADFWARVIKGREAYKKAKEALHLPDDEKYEDYMQEVMMYEPEPDHNDNYSVYLSERHEMEDERMLGDDELLTQVKHLQTVKTMIKILDKEKREVENKVKHKFVQEAVEKIEFSGEGYARYYQRGGNKTKTLDVRISKPDDFVLGVQLEKIDREVGYLI